MIVRPKADLLPSAGMRKRGIGVRPVREDDHAWLRALYAASRAEEMALLPWPEPLKALFLADQFRLQHAHYTGTHPGADLLVVTLAGGGKREDIGRLYLDRSISPWRLIEITLAASVRGGGIGTLLLEWLCAAAREAGAAIDLHVARDNPGALRFYERLGFRAIPAAEGSHHRMLRGT